VIGKSRRSRKWLATSCPGRCPAAALTCGTTSLRRSPRSWASPLEDLAPGTTPERAREDNPTQSTGYLCQPITLAALLAEDDRPTWLVKRLLVKDQPALIGGPKKVLKTSLLMDLAVSLAAGEPFLGEFQVYQRLNVLFLSGESGRFTLRETAARICAAKGLSGDCVPGLFLDFRLPRLGVADEMDELRRALEKHRIDVVIIDPIYLCLLSGSPVDAANVFQMGGLLLSVATACLGVGATPVLSHHAGKHHGTVFEPLELEDLAYAGFAEFARQWLLVSRREAYVPGSGFHPLWLNVGGSCGQSGLWGVDIDEGQLADDFGGRHWDVSVRTGNEVKEERAGDAASRKQQREAEQIRDDADALLRALDRLSATGSAVRIPELKASAALSGTRSERAIARLLEDGILLKTEVPRIGNTGPRTVAALRRKDGPDE
jgi:hypothetical protein